MNRVWVECMRRQTYLARLRLHLGDDDSYTADNRATDALRVHTITGGGDEAAATSDQSNREGGGILYVAVFL